MPVHPLPLSSMFILVQPSTIVINSLIPATPLLPCSTKVFSAFRKAKAPPRLWARYPSFHRRGMHLSAPSLFTIYAPPQRGVVMQCSPSTDIHAPLACRDLKSSESLHLSSGCNISHRLWFFALSRQAGTIFFCHSDTPSLHLPTSTLSLQTNYTPKYLSHFQFLTHHSCLSCSPCPSSLGHSSGICISTLWFYSHLSLFH